MIEDLDNINITIKSQENTTKLIQEKNKILENIILNYITKQTKNIFKLSVKDITKDFFNLQSLPKIFELTEKNLLKKICLLTKNYL